MFFRNKTDNPPITVPAKIHARARRAVGMGGLSSWVDATMYSIGQNVARHRNGDRLLDEAIEGAQALLALLVEAKRKEEL